MRVKGFASTPARDLSWHVIQPNAFAESILRKGLGGPKGIKFLIRHDVGQMAGLITKLEQRDGGLWLEADLNEETTWGRDWASAIRVNKGASLSVGFYTIDADIEKDARGMEYLSIIKAELLEVSLVVEPANPNAILMEWE